MRKPAKPPKELERFFLRWWSAASSRDFPLEVKSADSRREAERIAAEVFADARAHPLNDGLPDDQIVAIERQVRNWAEPLKIDNPKAWVGDPDPVWEELSRRRLEAVLAEEGEPSETTGE